MGRSAPKKKRQASSEGQACLKQPSQSVEEDEDDTLSARVQKGNVVSPELARTRKQQPKPE